MIKQIELDKTNTLNTIETKLRNIESKISATPDAVCENAEIIKLQEDLLSERLRNGTGGTVLVIGIEYVKSSTNKRK